MRNNKGRAAVEWKEPSMIKRKRNGEKLTDVGGGGVHFHYKSRTEQSTWQVNTSQFFMS
jgi:hypothetical protein